MGALTFEKFLNDFIIYKGPGRTWYHIPVTRLKV